MAQFVVYYWKRARKTKERGSEMMTVFRINRQADALLLKGIVLFFCALFLFSPLQAEGGTAETDTRLICLNVGKADCLLLLSGEQAYLIDTGYEQTFPLLLSMLEEYHVTALDGVFLTHAHKDHYGGMKLLAASDIQVNAWYASAISFDLPKDGHPAEEAARIAGKEVIWLSRGDVISLDNGGSFTVLGPVKVNEENENNNSLVMRFECADGSILFTGDMKEEEEESLLAAGLLEHADLLKCGHHGDGGATKKALLGAVTPKAAVISTCTGEEPDTPSAKVLQRLNEAGCQVAVTQDAQDALECVLQDGNVTVIDVAFSALPPRQTGITMRIDIENDLLILESDEEITVANAVLYSSEGTQLFSLGDLHLAAGESVSLGSGKTKVDADLILQDKRIWSQKKLDAAVLYDQYGRGIAWADNGLIE